MKKLISVLMGIAVVSSAGASVISCGAVSLAGEEGKRAVLVTDGGNVNDKSFNEGALNGIRKYGRDNFDLDYRGNYVEAKNNNAQSLEDAYRVAFDRGADAMVLAGFIHEGTIEMASKLMNGKTVVLADGVPRDKNGNEVGDKFDNVISIKFNSELAGFQAGFDAAHWVKGNYEEADANGDGIIKIGTFAGMSNKYSVDNYMWGMLVGVDLYNKLNAGDADYKAIQLANDNIVKDGVVDFANMKAVKSNDNQWFTQSFAVDDSANAMADLLFNKGADIVFPVAGVQIEAILAKKAYDTKKHMKLIGVDTNQAHSYESYKGRFLSSAIKNLEQAIADELLAAKSLGASDEEAHDGSIAKPHENWSINVIAENEEDHLNLIKKHAVSYEAVGYDAAVSELQSTIIKAFASTGLGTEEYMNGTEVAKATQLLLDNWESIKAAFDVDLQNLK
ncbi:BMP family ABC transporter substrate-binding protein [[Acholeplasma] multilocale]|uniref:BMP family ABC transporter substrate-binding protein n=1 Tax=[Acholeplasma] multilocale TaxID=264638 RepID=UPI00047A822F|nr:BMP family ABC transporter substrate-binding protein [[Acholeplasma] multilocale]